MVFVETLFHSNHFVNSTVPEKTTKGRKKVKAAHTINSYRKESKHRDDGGCLDPTF